MRNARAVTFPPSIGSRPGWGNGFEQIPEVGQNRSNSFVGVGHNLLVRERRDMEHRRCLVSIKYGGSHETTGHGNITSQD